MKYGLYCMQDKAAHHYLAPQCEATEETAVRNFKVSMNRKDLFLFMSPTDFALYKIGEFDDISAEIKLMDSPEFICDGLSVLEKKNEV